MRLLDTVERNNDSFTLSEFKDDFVLRSDFRMLLITNEVFVVMGYKIERPIL